MSIRFKVIVPVHVEWDGIEPILDHDIDPGSYYEDRSGIFENAIQVAIEERPLVPWLVEERFLLYDSIPDMTRSIRRIDDGWEGISQ